MKTKAQKAEQIEKGSDLLDKSQSMVFTDFSQLPAEKVRELRRQLNESGAKMFVIKKRLLNILMKQKGLDFDLSRFKFSVGTIFSPDGIDSSSSTVYKFFKELKEEDKKILGGYDLSKKQFVEPSEVLMLGSLPPREVLLAQVLSMFVAPLRGFMYVLDQKSKQS